MTATKNAAALLPCPFCGSNSIDPKGWASANSAGPACDDCGASAGNVSNNLADNIAAWNTRATHSQPDAALERLETKMRRAAPQGVMVYADEVGVWADELATLRATLAQPDALLPREGMTNIVIGATRHYGGEAWFRELTVAGVTFLAPLDEQEKARGIISALTSQPSGGVETLPVDVHGQWYEVPIPVQLHIIGLRERLRGAAEHPVSAVRRALERFVETTQDDGSTDLPRDVLDGLIAFGYMTKRRAGKHGFFYEMTTEGDAVVTHPSADAPGVAVDEWPELPKASIPEDCDGECVHGPYYTADQMREYALAAMRVRGEQ